MRQVTTFLLALLCAAAFGTNSLTSKTLATVKSPATVSTNTDTMSLETKVCHVLVNSGIIAVVNGKIVDLRGNAQLHEGELIHLSFPGGFDTAYSVKANENPWVAARNLIQYLEPLYGSVMTGKKATAEASVNNAGLLSAMLAKVPSWLWMVLFLLTTGAIAFAVNRRQKRLAEENRIANDPVLAGPPILKEGITRENIYEVARYAAQTVLNTPLPINIKKITNGNMFGPAEETYYNGAPSKPNLNYTGEDGYEVVVTIEGNEQEYTVHTLQGCANPVKAGKFITGKEGFRFVPKPVGANIPLEVVDAPNEAGSNVTVMSGPTPEMILSSVKAIKEFGGSGSVELGGKTADGNSFTYKLTVVKPQMMALPVNGNHVNAETAQA